MLRKLPRKGKSSPRAETVVAEAKRVRRRKAPLCIVRLTFKRQLDDETLSVLAQYSDLQPRWIFGRPGAWQGVRLTWHWRGKLDDAYEEALSKSLF